MLRHLQPTGGHSILHVVNTSFEIKATPVKGCMRRTHVETKLFIGLGYRGSVNDRSALAAVMRPRHRCLPHRVLFHGGDMPRCQAHHSDSMNNMQNIGVTVPAAEDSSEGMARCRRSRMPKVQSPNP